MMKSQYINMKKSGYGIPRERTLKRKKNLAASDRSTGQVREAKYVGRETPQVGSRIVGSAEAAVGLSPEEIRARRKVACVAHKPLGAFFVPMRIYRDIRLGYLEDAIVIFPVYMFYVLGRISHMMGVG